MELFLGVAGLFGGGGGAAATGAATAAGSAVSTASTIGTILEGGATVLGLVSSIAAGSAQQEQMELAAIDAEREQPLEILQNIDRRTSLKAAAADAIGEMDTAYAASGVDLSFGSARQARQDVFRETDLGLTTDAGTTMSRLSRLQERASSYRQMGKRAMRAGVLGGLAGAASGFSRMAGRYPMRRRPA
ncbi:hypothetical protein [uncultured Nitratireductor sp.]|uniref:hypothetical protein n=1 Tax=uncultured Nitratireductor sp. TaxID=520953 RepID=UPI0025E654C3|nr:hypothetical protein [uncultured Nitratireductor sp.]